MHLTSLQVQCECFHWAALSAATSLLSHPVASDHPSCVLEATCTTRQLSHSCQDRYGSKCLFPSLDEKAPWKLAALALLRSPKNTKLACPLTSGSLWKGLLLSYLWTEKVAFIFCFVLIHTNTAPAADNCSQNNCLLWTKKQYCLDTVGHMRCGLGTLGAGEGADDKLCLKAIKALGRGI